MTSTGGLLQFAHSQGFQFSDPSVAHNLKNADQDPNSAKWGLLCGLLDAMDEVSKEERVMHEAQFELESREFEHKFAATVSADILSKRTQAANSLSDHLSELAAVDRSELLRRIQAPFTEPHLALEEAAHADMVAVVEHAFEDICSVKQDMELATWTHGATVTITDLVCVHFRVPRGPPVWCRPGNSSLTQTCSLT
eukprot:2147089-Rhodomonas_salina.3